MLTFLRELKTLYRREMTHLMRDRHTLIYSVAIPLFLYPALLFVVFQALALIQGWKDRRISEIEIVSAVDQPLLERLIDDDSRLLRRGGEEAVSPDREEIARRLREREVDAVLLVEGNARRGEALGIEIVFNSVRDGSLVARDRLQQTTNTLREKMLLLRAFDEGWDESYLSVLEIEEQDVASGERKANVLLSLILPLLMVVILVMGAFYPALDTGAGERERRTLETTLVSPVSRVSMVLSKYLAVVSVSLLAFGLNFASMAFSMKHLLVQLKVQSYGISLVSVVVVCCAAALLAGLIAALLIVVAFLARSFKEGQSYMTPVYLVVILPMVVTLSPDTHLTSDLAGMPILNIILVFRDVLQSRFDWPLIVGALLSSGVYVGLALWLAVRIVAREEFLMGEGVVRRLRPRPVLLRSRA